MKIERKSFSVRLDLSKLRIRWSDHIFIKDGKKIIGEGVVYKNDWGKAEKLAQAMALEGIGALKEKLPVAEQVFVNTPRLKLHIKQIQERGSNLKVKTGRNIFDDIKVLKFIKYELGFKSQIRIDANQGYSLKQLCFILPTLESLGIRHIEEPVEIGNLIKAKKLLQMRGMKLILDETLQNDSDWDWAMENKLLDVANIKISRIGDMQETLRYINKMSDLGSQVVIGCSEELERGMEAIYALGHMAQKKGILLEVEGYGPLRLKHLSTPFPRILNKLENLIIAMQHKIHQVIFDTWWSVMRSVVSIIKETKKLSSLSLHLVKLTGKYNQKVHPKHLISKKYHPIFLSYISTKDIVLDIGCGNGQNSILIAKQACHVCGFDIDKSQLAIAKSDAKCQGIRNIDFKLISGERKIPYKSNYFDKIVFLGVLEHLMNRTQVLDNVRRLLKQNGLLLLGIPNENTSWKLLQRRFGIPHYTDPDHKIEYTKATITSELLYHGFEIVKIFPTAFDTPWAGVIDFIGGLSLRLYERLILWKWEKAKENPEESISFLVVARKKP